MYDRELQLKDSKKENKLLDSSSSAAEDDNSDSNNNNNNNDHESHTSGVEAKVLEFELQVRILKLEKELEKTRMELATVRKSEYQPFGSDLTK